MASAPELIRHYMELRGIGVIDVRRLFGMGAIKMNQEIDMVIKLEPWDDTAVYDRLGLENTYTEILGASPASPMAQTAAAAASRGLSGLAAQNAAVRAES